MSKLLTVFGATGNQGGSVISEILSHPEVAKNYKIRAVTRDPSKPAAKELASKGCETVKADFGDSASIEAAVSGAYAVYAVTDYWSLMSLEKEKAQGIAIADACAKAGVKHVVWSSLPHTTELTDSKLPGIDHFVSKAEVEKYFEKIKGKSGMWVSYYMPAFYMSNFKTFIAKGPDGVPAYSVPGSDKSLYPLIDIVGDTGKWVAGLLELGQAADGAKAQAVGEWLTGPQIVAVLSEAAGTTVNFNSIPRDMFKGFLLPQMGELGAEELTQNMELVDQYSYYGKGTDKTQAENDKYLLKGTKVTTFKEFAKANGPWQW